MMMQTPDRGFEEISHTADWSLRVWAPDLPSLFAQAAVGMYWLMQLRLEDIPRVERALEVRGSDAESLLVAFLGELLFLGESEALAFDQFTVRLHGSQLHALMQGARIRDQQKEIKAVTFHNLAVIESSAGFTTTIVFDV